MASIDCSLSECTVHINFDRDERELMARDTFAVLTGDGTEPPPADGRRVGDVYISGLDHVRNTFSSAWFFAGDGWRRAEQTDLRAHAIPHPVLASRVLSISPCGRSIHWSKRDTIVRRERRARTLSRSMQQQPECPTTPPPTGGRSAPVSPRSPGYFARSDVFTSFSLPPTPVRAASRSTSANVSPSIFSSGGRTYSTAASSVQNSPSQSRRGSTGGDEWATSKYTPPQRRALESAFQYMPTTPTKSRTTQGVSSPLEAVHEDQVLRFPGAASRSPSRSPPPVEPMQLFVPRADAAEFVPHQIKNALTPQPVQTTTRPHVMSLVERMQGTSGKTLGADTFGAVVHELERIKKKNDEEDELLLALSKKFKERGDEWSQTLEKVYRFQRECHCGAASAL